MVLKKLVLLLIITFILTNASLNQVAYSTEEDQTFYSLNQGGLIITIEAPAQAWPGDKLNITIRVEALTAIHVDFINVSISCLKDNMTETSLRSVKFLKDFNLSSGETYEKRYEVVIHENALPGLIFGKLEHKWYIKGDIRTYVEDVHAFQATFVQNKAYQDLLQAYEALDSFCNDLKDNYTRLEGNFTDLQMKYQGLESKQIGENNATGLMYLFLITTGIFVATTILLMAKRPKATTW